MKHLATFLYWLAAVFALALILVSFDYRFGRALFLATSLLPGMFCAKFFLPMALRAERRRVSAVICVVASTLIIEWMSLLLASFHTAPFENLMRAPFPGIFESRFYFDSAGGDYRPGGVAVSLSEKETFRGEIRDVYFQPPQGCAADRGDSLCGV